MGDGGLFGSIYYQLQHLPKLASYLSINCSSLTLFKWQECCLNTSSPLSLSLSLSLSHLSEIPTSLFAIRAAAAATHSRERGEAIFLSTLLVFAAAHLSPFVFQIREKGGRHLRIESFSTEFLAGLADIHETKFF